VDIDRQDGHETLNPAALGAADVARLLGVPVAVVEQHVAEDMIVSSASVNAGTAGSGLRPGKKAACSRCAM